MLDFIVTLCKSSVLLLLNLVSLLRHFVVAVVTPPLGSHPHAKCPPDLRGDRQIADLPDGEGPALWPADGEGPADPSSIPLGAPVVPTSVNYHFTRACNYKCGFCFHTAKTSFMLPLEEAKRGLTMLRDAGMVKINFSGGEPFLPERGRYLGEMVTHCKRQLRLPSVSIVSNGSLITERWLATYGEHVDILAVSCDSFDEDTNRQIGRGAGRRNHVETMRRVRDWCLAYKIAFKINTVVNSYNVHEDLADYITELRPVRWKVFQCLLIDGENSGKESLRQVQPFLIADRDFQSFLERHRHVSCLVPESNEKMRDSYLILDEYMRFLNCTGGAKEPTCSVLDVGVESAIQHSGFDERMFLQRGGKYVWSKADMRLEW
uniref:S-adenosylmethionine-dependent nucleotide dehydratase RSAD2 n=1 Tax=Petromyzon marinus TaxID=7757 RepID=A0AAJ7TE44_PETMA|nr:radical S-adenosyl methionine domain-containing protein 2 [Petromyzon marinus]